MATAPSTVGHVATAVKILAAGVLGLVVPLVAFVLVDGMSAFVGLVLLMVGVYLAGRYADRVLGR